MARPEKVAVVDEIRTKLAEADADRAHRVPRADGARAGRRCAASLRGAGTEYKVFKNTLARRAVAGVGPRRASPSMFEGPVAIAFVRGDAAAAAKALRDFGRNNPALVAEGRPARRAGHHRRPTSRRWPSCRPATCCSRRSPARSRRRSSRPPACSRRSPATSPTA